MDVEVIVKTVLVNNDGFVLVLRRSPLNKWRPGGTDFPGGGREPGEDVIQTAVRETYEETGIELDLAKVDIIYAKADPSKESKPAIVRILCMAQVTKLAVTLNFENDRYEWLAPKAAVAKFETNSWGTGLQFAIDHNFLLQ